MTDNCAGQDPEARLDQIARLIHPCPAPDVANGYDLCPVHPRSSWPCNSTKAAWLARGIDVRQQVRNAMNAARAQMRYLDF